MTKSKLFGFFVKTDQDSIANVAKRHGVSEASIYVWQMKFNGMDTNDVKRLKSLESENSRLKKLLAERDLEIEVMKEIAAKIW
jgi:putative transposase